MASENARTILAPENPAIILIVDDEPDTRSLVSHTLKIGGHTIIEAGDGLEAKECCAKHVPDLIVTDIAMPNMDGNEFVRWFRAEFTEYFVPILMLTALDDVENKVEGLNVGADDYLTKSFNFLELQARVQALLRIRELTESLYNRKHELEKVNAELSRTQDELVAKERELVAIQFAGAASHNLGQPLTSILLNCRLLEKNVLLSSDKDAPVSKELKQARAATKAIQDECESIKSVLQNMREVDPSQAKSYIGDLTILDLSNDTSGSESLTKEDSDQD